jgi:hypothetical protein
MADDRSEEGASASADAPSTVSDDVLAHRVEERLAGGAVPRQQSDLTVAQYEYEFLEGGRDLEYCEKAAVFKHQDSCEFILFCGGEWTECVREMENFGCSPGFINAFKEAAQEHEYVLFYC